MTGLDRARARAMAIVRCSVLLLFMGILTACPRGPSFTVQIVNESAGKAASLLQVFDDAVGQPVSDDLLVGPNVGPGRSRSITVPLSEAEGGTALLVEAVSASGGGPGLSLVQGVAAFAEGQTFVATIFDDHIEIDELN